MDLPCSAPPTNVPSGVHDDGDVTKRRLLNDYSAYSPVSTEPGNEQGRLMQVLPAKVADDDDEEIACALFDAPVRFEGIVYIALSYCWGSLSDQRTISLIHHDMNKSKITTLEDERLGPTTTLSVDSETSKPFNVTESLYQALKSIRKAIPRLKNQFPILDYQPMWVDALCINQSNIEERNCQVSMMGNIYSQAWFVFIWLGESEDVMRGLNLIQAMVDLLHKTWGSEFDIIDPNDDHLKILLDAKYKFDNEMLGPEDCFQILERLFSHPYFKRIWVLQEATINAESTWIHVTKASVPWNWVIVADRFRQYWRRIYPTADRGRLPLMWGHLLKHRLLYARKLQSEKKLSVGNSEVIRVLVPLYTLFTNTYEEFAATDLRDKLFALLDLAVETRPGTPSRQMLAPNYTKTVSQVFSNFTRWCIQSQGNLEVLSLLCGGPRRLHHYDVAELSKNLGPISIPYIDARTHPSWALWPTTGGYWSETSLTKVNDKRTTKFDLASNQELSLYNLASHPFIQLPDELVDRFLSLGGKRIGTIKSILALPIRCFASDLDHRSLVKAKWLTDEIKNDMEKHEKSYKMHLTHPYREGKLMDGAIVPIWYYLNKGKTEGTIIGDEMVEISSQEWLGRNGGRYQGKHEAMFRDFLETLLLSPVYRNEAVSIGEDEKETSALLDGPLSDPEIGTSFAMFWAENDPQFTYLPPRIAQHLRSQMFERGIPREKQFPFLFLGHGKCFFITEDERMGLCSPDARPGDLVVGLGGSRVPLVLRPAHNERQPYGEDWTFKGHEELKATMFRLIGECYLHERMTSAFFDDTNVNRANMEVFNLY
jgi:hypothetical protein